MNILYSSQKLQELFSDDTIPVSANASGDGDLVPGRCCRLCGGDTNLRYFGDTYFFDGVEERYDQLLFDCFKVKVTPSDCMICEWCVRALRNADRFRALVNAAFDNPLSGDELSSNHTTLKSNSSFKASTDLSVRLELAELPKTPCILSKKSESRKKVIRHEAKLKRTNIPCVVCKQRYPMLVSTDTTTKSFICSRCKKNTDMKGSICRKCNIVMPVNMLKEHLNLHVKAEVRGKSRAQPSRSPILPLVHNGVRHRQKYQCSRCPKKYAVAKNLAVHVRNAHGDSLDNFCIVCGQDMETREKLEDHLADHSGIHQCEECLLVFKTRQNLAGHSCCRHKWSTAS